jgi:NTP pyrophosphatase (non-canonical NTP hydrolase)
MTFTLEDAHRVFDQSIGRDHFEYENFVKEHWGGHGLDCTILGLVGEAGEVADLRKKEYHGIPRDIDRMNEEVADVLFYIYAYCIETGQDIERLMEANMEKLRARYPDGFVLGGGIR